MTEQEIMEFPIRNFANNSMIYMWVIPGFEDLAYRYCKKHKLHKVNNISRIKEDENGELMGHPGHFLFMYHELCWMLYSGNYYKLMADCKFSISPSVIRAPRREN